MNAFIMAAEAAAEAAGAHGAEAAALGGEAAAHGGAFPPFDPTLFSSQLFWFLVAFGILLYVMKNKALPAVSETLEKRKTTIEADLAGARAAGEAAEAARAGHEKLIAEARAKARGQIDDVRAKSAAEVAAETQKSEAQVAKTIADAEGKIATLRADALANVRATASELAVEIAQKVGGISVTREEAEKAVDAAAGRSAA
jgi:F-type H+-transporting ATPase subunit b